MKKKSKNLNNQRLQIDLLNEVFDKLLLKLDINEASFFEKAALYISKDVVYPRIKTIESKANSKRYYTYKYLYPSLFKKSEDDVISSRTVSDLFKDKESGKMNSVSQNNIPTWCILALFVGKFGWKGYGEKLTIDEGIKKFPKTKNLPTPSSTLQGITRYVGEIKNRKKNPFQFAIIGIASVLILIFLLNYMLPFYNQFHDDVNGILILPIQNDNVNFRSDLLETLETNIDPSLNIKVRRYGSIFNTLLGLRYTENQVEKIGKAQNAKIVIWGELISKKEKFWPNITIITDKNHTGFFNRDQVDMDYLDIGEKALPPILVDKPEVIIQFINGLMELESKNYQDALRLFLEVENKINISEVKSKNLLLLIGGCYKGTFAKDGDETNLQKAEEYFKKTISLFPNSPSAYNNLAGVYLQKKEYDKALYYSNQLVKNELANDNTWYQIGLMYYHLDSLERAIECFDNALEKAPNIYRYYSMIGSCYKRKGEYGLALEYLQKSIDLNKKDLEAIYEMGMCYFFKGDMQEAEHYLKKVVIKNGPSHFKALIALAGIYEKSDPKKAINYYKTANKINKSKFTVNLQIGNLYHNLGNVDSAIMYYNKALTLDSSRYEPWVGLGLLYDKKKKYKKAIHYLSKAVLLNEKQYPIWYRLGINYFSIHDYKQAHNSQLQAISIKSDYDLSWGERGRIFIEQKKYKEAIRELNIAISYNSNSDIYFYLKGIAEKELNSTYESIKSFKRAIDINQQDYESWFQLGEAYFNQKNYLKAKESYTESIFINPDFYPSLIKIGSANAMLNNKQEAVEYFERSKKTEPRNSGVDFIIGMNYLFLDMTKEAEYMFTESLANGGKAYGNVGLGHIELINGDTSTAISFYAKGANLFMNSEHFEIFFREYIYLYKDLSSNTELQERIIKKVVEQRDIN